ncbi:MAG: phenylacetate--CoA ligase family protein [Candidatus Lokiarchaeia archaeon]
MEGEKILEKMEKTFYNPIIEKLPRNKLKEIQFKKLSIKLRQIFESSELLHKKFSDAKIKPEDIKSLEDIKKIPLISKSDVERRVTDGDPFGGTLCVDFDSSIHVIGPKFPMADVPMYKPITFDDLQWLINAFTRYWVMIGINQGDRVLMNMPSTHIDQLLSTATLIPKVTHGASERLKCLVLTNEGLLDLLIPRGLNTANYFKPSTIFMPQSYIATFENALNNLKLTPENLQLKSIVLVDDKESLSLTDRKKWSEKFGINIYSRISIIENLFSATDCKEINGLHAWEDLYIVESVDPESGEPVSMGETGKLTITNLFAEAAPLIRFVTDVEVSLDDEVCECGRTHIRIFPKKYEEMEGDD